MAGNIKKRISLSTTFLFWAVSWAKLVDQTVGTVGSHVITLRDIRVQSTLEFIQSHRRLPDASARDKEDLSPENLSKARQSIVTDYLIQDYLANIQTGIDLDVKNKDAQLTRLYVVEKAKLEAFNAKEGLSPQDIDKVIERKLRVDSFLDNQLAFRTNFLDAEVKEHYEKYRQDRFLNRDLAEVEKIVRADLKKEKLQLEFAQWIKNQIRRTEVTVLPIPVLTK